MLPLRSVSHPVGSWSDVCLSAVTQGLEETDTGWRSGHRDSLSVGQTVLLELEHYEPNNVMVIITLPVTVIVFLKDVLSTQTIPCS